MEDIFSFLKSFCADSGYRFVFFESFLGEFLAFLDYCWAEFFSKMFLYSSSGQISCVIFVGRFGLF